MTNEPDNSHTRPSQPTKAKQTDAGPDARDSKKTPSAVTPLHDPAGHEYGDRVEGDSKAMTPGDGDALSKNSRDRHTGDVGDGHKGARGDAKQGQPDRKEHQQSSTAGHQASTKPNAEHGESKHASKSAPSKESADGKGVRPQGGASGR